MSTYRSRATDGAAANAIDPGNYLPCRTCQGSTPRTMLSQYGGTCRDCFDDYCAKRNTATPRQRPMGRQEKLAVLEGLRSVGTRSGDGE